MPPALIAEAQEETAATITRIMLTFVGVALFCLLALLTGGERLNVPFAGPVSFPGFMVVGPLVLIALRIYLQIYVEHWRRLEPIRRRLPPTRAPTVAPLRNCPLRWFAAFSIYLLLPMTMLAFTLKAAVLPAWGAGLLCVTTAVIAGHLMLPLRWSWPSRATLSAGAAVLAAAIVYSQESPSRPFNLSRAQLMYQYLAGADLAGADLTRASLLSANLAEANLVGASLTHASLWDADLAGANLEDANLTGADLTRANLAGANLAGVNFAGVNFADANLTGADLAGINFAGTNFAGADLTGAALAGADLAGAELTRANLAGANLTGANLAGANLAGVRLTDADLTRADLAGAELSRAELMGANLTGAGFADADLPDANLAHAKLARADLAGANLKGANLAGADPGRPVFVRADRSDPAFAPATIVTQDQLDQACGDETTVLPAGLKVGSNCAGWTGSR